MSAAVKSSSDASSAPGRSNMVDAKREEFRKYLEKEGILESLTKALVTLYEEPEKPNDALGYLKNNFAGKFDYQGRTTHLKLELLFRMTSKSLNFNRL